MNQLAPIALSQAPALVAAPGVRPVTVTPVTPEAIAAAQRFVALIDELIGS